MANIGYIYKTTNIVNGKIYIGQHQSDYLDEDYLGSGIKIKRAIKKYGKINFVLEILCWKKTTYALNKYEKYFIRAFDSTNPKIGYNISKGGQIGRKGAKLSEEAKEKIRKANAGHKFQKGCIGWNKGKTGCYSKETIAKMSAAKKGKPFPKAAIEKARLVNTGRLVSEESRKKMSIAAIGNKRSLGKKHSDISKFKISQSNKGKHSIPMKQDTKNKIRVALKNKPWSENRRAAFERSKFKLIKEAV